MKRSSILAMMVLIFLTCTPVLAGNLRAFLAREGYTETTVDRFHQFRQEHGLAQAILNSKKPSRALMLEWNQNYSTLIQQLEMTSRKLSLKTYKAFSQHFSDISPAQHLMASFLVHAVVDLGPSIGSTTDPEPLNAWNTLWNISHLNRGWRRAARATSWAAGMQTGQNVPWTSSQNAARSAAQSWADALMKRLPTPDARPRRFQLIRLYVQAYLIKNGGPVREAAYRSALVHLPVQVDYLSILNTIASHAWANPDRPDLSTQSHIRHLRFLFDRDYRHQELLPEKLLALLSAREIEHVGRNAAIRDLPNELIRMAGEMLAVED